MKRSPFWGGLAPWLLGVLACGAPPEAPIASPFAEECNAASPPLAEIEGRPQLATNPGRSRCFRVEAAAGEYLRIVATTDGPDLTLSWLDEGGQERLRFDHPMGARTPEELHWVATGPGFVRVVEPDHGKVGEGQGYRVSLEVRRPAQGADRRLALAWSKLAGAEAARRRRTPEGFDAAIDAAREAQKDFEALGAAAASRRAAELRGRALEERLLTENSPQEKELRLAELAEVWRLVGLPAREAPRQNELGQLCRARGAWACADLAFRRAQELYQTLEEPTSRAVALCHLGLLDRDLGQAQRALDRFGQALRLLPAGDVPGATALTTALTAKLMAGRGSTLLDLGRPKGAVRELTAALEVASRAGDLVAELEVRSHLAEERYRAGEFAAAEHGFAEIARQTEDPQERTRALQNAAWCRLKAGYPAEAISAYEALLSEARGADVRTEVAIHSGWALAAQQLGRLEIALDHAQRALALRHQLRAGSDRLDQRLSYGASFSDIADTAVELLLALHERTGRRVYLEEAFRVGESVRARALWTAITQPTSPRTQTERSERRVSSAAERLQAAEDLLPEEREVLERELRAALDAQRHSTRLDLATAEPEPTGLALSGIQSRLAAGTDLLLAYDLGKRRSILWEITRERVVVHSLQGVEALSELIQRATRVLAGFGTGREQALTELSTALLGPVEELADHRRLFLVAEGALAGVPFAALPRPGAAEPLVASHEVSYWPSVAVAVALEERQRKRPAPALTLAFVGDPVSAEDDERLPPEVRQRTRRAGFPRLTGTAREAAALRALVPSPRAEFMLGFAATKESILNGALARVSMLHLATHGVLDTEHPELSSLVLTRFDASGGTREGFLYAHEVAALPLAAELAVLSACETAQGVEIPGEGLVGLPHAFLEAGATRVLVSLWRVDDEATAELMERFYRGLWGGGLAPGEALRQAQLALAQEGKGRPPREWAAFVLIGPP